MGLEESILYQQSKYDSQSATVKWQKNKKTKRSINMTALIEQF